MFGSNVHPPKFGKGREKLIDWICICETFNKRYWMICQGCGISRELAKEAQDKLNG